MKNRRDFLRDLMLLSGAAGLSATLPESLMARLSELAENPLPAGSRWTDAEHIVFLMQENRSFDHYFGMLKGVRGFADPRVYKPDGQLPVWLQPKVTEKENFIVPPFRLDLEHTRISWQGSLPHAWGDQTHAFNRGRHDAWIAAKGPECMGYFTRQDLPFYYALADSFTICDHYFCSVQAGTTPNRLFFWTGTNRAMPNGEAVIHNSQAESRTDTYVKWPSIPEMLQELKVDWRVYQHELWSADMPEAQDDWVGNYGDNPLEYLAQYHVKKAAYFREKGNRTNHRKESAKKVTEAFAQLSPAEQELHEKAFTTNRQAPGAYLEMEDFEWINAAGKTEKMRIPKADLFHEFRKDVSTGKLPTVSWLVAPQRYSEHTSSPLYGTWYVSEALRILAENPDVWRKTIFVLTYDENDGYFDHVPPFVPPKPGDATSGKCTTGIDPSRDYHTSEDKPIGLGFRVPTIIVSPWTTGGYVNSEVFDHSSALQFLETYLGAKTGREIRHPNVSSWRRAVCGDLTSVFQNETNTTQQLTFENAPQVLQKIQWSRDQPETKAKELPEKELVDAEQYLPQQEKGIKPACVLPYIPLVNARLDRDQECLTVVMSASDASITPQLKGKAMAFRLMSKTNGVPLNFAIEAGATLQHQQNLNAEKKYNCEVSAANGFYRRFEGDLHDPLLEVDVHYEKISSGRGEMFSGKIAVQITNHGETSVMVHLRDPDYGNPVDFSNELKAGQNKFLTLDLESSHRWYHLILTVEGYPDFQQIFAGHIENGKPGFTDPKMGGL